MSENILSFYQSLSILYAEQDDANHHNKNLLCLMCKNFQSSLNSKDIVDQYNNYKKLHGCYFDIVIVDNSFSLEIVEKILKINPNQKIIANIKQNGPKNIAKFSKYGVNDFLSEPLNRETIRETISALIQESDYNSILFRHMKEYEKLDNEMSSQIRKYEDKLAQMHDKLDAQSDFFASMSHEIRTPMNAIIGMSQILTNDYTLSSKQLQSVKTIHRSSSMLVGIVNDILDFSKIEAGKLTLENVSFNLHMILDYLTDMTSLKVKEKGLKLIFNVHSNVDKYYIGDSLRISQVLLNLVSNAVKFTKKGSITLHIKTLKQEDNFCSIQFEVQDTGIGIQKSNLEKLFENYTQAGRDTSRKYGGTGLGLSISKQLTTLMGGEIWVESTYGQGSSFFVNLILEKDLHQEKLTNHIYTAEDLQDLGYHKILVAEDNKINQAVIEGLLENTNIELVFAGDGKILLEELYNSEYLYKLILMDINMPNLNGYEATKKIREDARYDNTKIVALSGDVAFEDIQKSKELGMQEHLAKPIELHELYRVIVTTLE